ncbi:MAG: hypothetical protein B6229_07705 [Spirochaetaceae bacterium 4572_7]|nr:MAG: hypothetical protein B6229_07705 [Spirochaetaceae bacterium 4572_7]
MRKTVIIILLVLLPLAIYAQEDKTSFSISSGTEYLDDFFFNFGVSTISPIGQNSEIDVKIALNMKTTKDETGTTPMFNIPLKIGINFLFPTNENLIFLVGTGLSPTIRLAGDDKGFLIGPNVKAGVRYKIHPSMSVLLEVCQSLLIGPPDWMYPSTEMILGVNFYL